MQSCLKSCGDCASAKNLPGWRRTGTRKSRAPSGALRHARRPDVDEAELVHRAPDRGDGDVVDPEVALHLPAAHVEPPVAELQDLVDVLLVELERERRRARDDLEPVEANLHHARRQVGVHGLGARAGRSPPPHAARTRSAPRARSRRLRGVLRVRDELENPGVVPEVDEDEATMVAPRVGPAGNGDAAADVLGAHVAAVEVAPARGPRFGSTTASSGTG